MSIIIFVNELAIRNKAFSSLCRRRRLSCLFSNRARGTSCSRGGSFLVTNCRLGISCFNRSGLCINSGRGGRDGSLLRCSGSGGSSLLSCSVSDLLSFILRYLCCFLSYLFCSLSLLCCSLSSVGCLLSFSLMHNLSLGHSGFLVRIQLLLFNVSSFHLLCTDGRCCFGLDFSLLSIFLSYLCFLEGILHGNLFSVSLLFSSFGISSLFGLLGDIFVSLILCFSTRGSCCCWLTSLLGLDRVLGLDNWGYRGLGDW